MATVKKITDSIGRTRTVTYKHRYQNLAPGKFYYFRGTKQEIHSLRVLISRWNSRNGTNLVGTLTKNGTLRVENWYTTAVPAAAAA